MKIAVTGIGIISGIGRGADRTLDSIREGRTGLGPVTLFPTVHDIPVSEVKYTNAELARLLGLDGTKKYTRTALLGMMAAYDALQDAGECPDGLRTGLVSSTSVGGMDLTENFYRDFMTDPAKGRLRDVAGHGCGESTEAIARYCGIEGFRATISTACSSAANAVMFGARLIRSGILDRVVVGGADSLCAFTLNGFNSLMILDKEPCRPFDATRAGLNLGEGAAYLVLQRGDIAGKEPYCYLSGWANANDAFHQTASSPEGEGAYLAMKEALEMSGAGSVDYINAHGTGTPNNDASEYPAVRRLFGDGVPAFSSTKPFTGHTLAAAGGIEAVLSVLSVARGALYPNLNFSRPMEGMDIKPVQAYSEGSDIRNVMSNSFGFGGNSSTLVFTAG